MPDFRVFGGAIAETADFRENASKMRPPKNSAPAAGDAVATSWNMHNRIEKRGIDSVCAPLSIPEVSAPTDTTGPGKRQSGGHASEFRTSDEKKCRNDNAPPLPPHGHNGGLGSWIVVDPGVNDEIHGVARTFAKAINKIFLNNDSQNT